MAENVYCPGFLHGQEALEAELAAGTDFETFFARAPRMNPATSTITGTVCAKQ